MGKILVPLLEMLKKEYTVPNTLISFNRSFDRSVLDQNKVILSCYFQGLWAILTFI